MNKLLAILLISLVFTVNAASKRESVVESILLEFYMELSVDIANTTTHEAISVSDRYNSVKNVQTITTVKNGTETTKTYTTVALFNENLVVMKSGDSDTCHYRDISETVKLIPLLRGVFIDPSLSPMKEFDDTHELEFTIDFDVTELIDNWTHFYFDSDNFKIKRIEMLTEASKEPWIDFTVVKPIESAKHSKSDFTIEGCTGREDYLLKDM